MRFRILGPLEVLADGTWQPIGAEKWRSLLACLLLRAGEVVSTDALTDELWGDAPPAKAKNLISIYVLRLRRLLGDADGKLLARRAPGYVLNIADGDLDSAHFGSLVADGQHALADGDPVRAVALLSAGLGLWRGPFLADVPPTPLTMSHFERAAELRLTATELWAAGCIACDRHNEVIPELRKLVGEQPLREGLWLQLMRALDGAGRHAEALGAYAQAREAISEELGVEPGAELQRLYADLLAADAEATAPADRPARPGGPGRSGRPVSSGRPESEVRPDAVSREGERTASIPVGDLPGSITMGNYADLGAPSGVGAAPAAQVPPAFPADTVAPRPTQLPADIGDFTGRHEHVRHLCDMLTSGGRAGGPGAVPIAFVAGAGGLGKTTLAVHAAHQIRDHFPDGQLYVDLLGATAQPLPPGDVLARFLRDLGVEGDRVPAGDEERAALYRTRLTGRRVLILLDNARDTAQVRPLLPGSASCAVLVTTRNRTADLASTRFFDLNVLDDDEALALFITILGDERAVAEPEATAEVLVACAGLPLAIRICAARLAARGQWKIATMAKRLRDERRRLDELKVGDLAVRASFQVSYDSLGKARHGADPKRAFRLLGLWQGPWISLQAAVALYGAPGGAGSSGRAGGADDSSGQAGGAGEAQVGEDEVADALENLVDAHLLESPEPDWYRFHDLLRVYATERVRAEDAQDDRAAAEERVLGWYLRTADGAANVAAPHRYQIPLEADQQAGVEPARGRAAPDAAPARFDTTEAALAWYDSERANVVAATRQAAQAGLHDVAWRLPAGLFPVFNRRDNWTDVVVTHRVALDSARLAGSLPGEGWVRNNLGFALAKLRDPEAYGHLERAQEIRREIGDPVGETQTALSLADAYLQMRGPAAALRPFQRALAPAREAGNPFLLVTALNNLGEVYLDLGLLDEAAECLQEAHDLSARHSVYGQAHALHNLGRVCLERGRLDDAFTRLRESLEMHERNGDLRGQGVALNYQGRAQHVAGDLGAARRSWTSALAIFRELRMEPETLEVEAALAALP
jgi:DNA-binding SARP family transcriptional activator/tetratricopeptide (TPR) repeat protein